MPERTTGSAVVVSGLLNLSVLLILNLSLSHPACEEAVKLRV